MARGSRPVQRSRREAGSALLLAIFLSASLFLLAFAAAPGILNQGRREREQQLIWRGNKYVRGIRLYFQKNGRFPQNKEELLKGTLDVHFVRKAYTDPINPAGDDWRMIYVAPSGQLVGSVHYRSLQEMAAAQGADVPGGGLAALFGGAPGAQPGGPPQPPQGGGGATAMGAATGGGAAQRGGRGSGGVGARPGPQAGTRGGTAGDAQSSSGFGEESEFAPLEAVDGPVLGASMIGIASKMKQSSLLVYQGRDTYFDWEFIWNPLLGAIGGIPGIQQPGADQVPDGGIQQGPAPGTEAPVLGPGRGGALINQPPPVGAQFPR
jgi:hypothetical protein